MLNFGQLEVVEKTFTRDNAKPRGQAYEFLKFRRYKSKAGKVAGEETEEDIKEVFIFADNAFEALNLNTLALTQAKFMDETGNLSVYLLVLEDQDEVAPVAKFCRQQTNADGSKPKKGKMFNNSFLKEDLETVGILDATTFENQYLAGVDVTASITGLPSQVQKVYKLVKDESVNSESDAEILNEAQANEVVAGEREFN